MTRPLLLCLFCLSLSTQSAASIPYRIVEQWTAADGLPVETIASLAVDQDKQLWMATYDGVVRYQGFDFQHFNRSTEPAFPSNRLMALHPAPDGGVILHFEDTRLGHMGDEGYLPLGRTEPGHIVVFDQQVWFIDPTTATLRSWRGNSDPQQRNAGQISAIAVDTFGQRLLLGATDGRVLFIGKEDPEPQLLTTAGKAGIVGVAGGPDGALLLVNQQQILTFVGADLSADHSQAIQLEHAQLKPVRATWTPRGWLLANLFASTGAGPHLVNATELHRLPVAEAISTSADRSPARIELVDAQGRRWINDGQQLIRDEEVVYRSKERIIDFAVDPFDQVWVTQPTLGLRLLKQAAIKTLGRGPGQLQDANITLVTEHDGKLLVGSWVELISLDPATGKWTQLLQRAVRDVLPDGDGLLVGSNGLCRMESAGFCEDVPGYPGRGTAEVLMLHRDALDNVWAGTEDGLYRRSADGHWHPEPLHQAIARTALESDSGRLLLGTNGHGILVLQVGEDAPPLRRMGTEQGLPSPFVRSLLDVQGHTLVGTEDAGMCLVSPELELVNCMGAKEGLPHHSVHYMIVDAVNRLWVNSNGGIYWVDLPTLFSFLKGASTSTPNFYRYGQRHGLDSVEGNGGVYRAGALTADGTIWFPNQLGLVSILPIETTRLDSPLPTRIRRLGHDNDGPLHLTRHARNLELELTAIALAEPENVQFRYRFEGDRGWTELGHRRHLDFRSLRPGRHRLEVSARHVNTPWSGAPERLEFTAGYRLHEHPAFRALLLIAALLAVLGLWFTALQRQKRLERRIEDRSKRLNQATQQVSRLAQSLQRVDDQHRIALHAVSKELRSALNAAMEPLLQQPRKNSKKKQASDSSQARAKTLSALIDQIGSFADSDAVGRVLAKANDEDPALPDTQRDESEDSPNANVDLMAMIRMEVLLHLADPDYSVEKLARRLGMSRSVLYRRVAEVFDSGPAELIRDLRLEQAGKLLQDTTDQVSTIAYATGFRSVSAFSKAFSKKMGISPRQWREQLNA